MDSHIETGSKVPPFYDSLLGKLIVWGNTRNDAVNIMQRALSTCCIDGVETNIKLHLAILNDSAFIQGGIDTQFLPELLAASGLRLEADDHA